MTTSVSATARRYSSRREASTSGPCTETAWLTAVSAPGRSSAGISSKPSSTGRTRPSATSLRAASRPYVSWLRSAG
ncbi:hypothetical protein LUX01_21675 [Streptomyces sudanensis]|uniref:hypothetical protein n=1 Tax=Streptomyces sudanensis TaxID=436397 RepID=UPI0020CFC89B|nr:hypothetical protein [Streptomyces sudanensis]MCP9988874.1 hypothetical protein [Streptomyces sudanensis]